MVADKRWWSLLGKENSTRRSKALFFTFLKNEIGTAFKCYFSLYNKCCIIVSTVRCHLCETSRFWPFSRNLHGIVELLLVAPARHYRHSNAEWRRGMASHITQTKTLDSG